MHGKTDGGQGIEGLLLDFGGVISVTIFEELALAERRIGLPPGTLQWRGPISPTTDELWQSMQRGEITERAYWEIRAKETGALLTEHWDVRTFILRMRPSDPNASIRAEAVETVRLARRAGLRVGILTNELELFYGKQMLGKMKILNDVHCVVDATHTGILKPDPRAYALGLQALGTQAARTLFVDDQLRNVQGAESAGLRAMLFDIRDPAGSYRRVGTSIALQDAATEASTRL